MARKKIIAGNWKMNMTPTEAVALVNQLKPLVVNDEVDVVFCVPAIDIIPAMEAAKGSNIRIGAENMYFEEKGAYTGEISPNMLVDAGVKYVIIGHSERREYFAETDETVNKKVLKAFEHGITPIICCGESLTQREQGITIDWIRQQVKIAFLNVTADQAKTAVILRAHLGYRHRQGGNHRAGPGGLRSHPCLHRRDLRRGHCRSHPYPVRRFRIRCFRSGAVCPAGYRRRLGRRRFLEAGLWSYCQLQQVNYNK